MEEILNFDTIAKYNAFNKNETKHPLVSIENLEKANPRKNKRLRYQFYTIFLKKFISGICAMGLITMIKRAHLYFWHPDR